MTEAARPRPTGARLCFVSGFVLGFVSSLARFPPPSASFRRLRPAGIDRAVPRRHSLRKIGNTNCPPAAACRRRAGREALMQMPEPDRQVIAAQSDIVAALRAIVTGGGVIVDAEELRAYRSEDAPSELQSLIRKP